MPIIIFRNRKLKNIVHRIFDDVTFQLDMLSCLLTNLKDEEYTQKGKHITSIGAHVRHTIEYLQILINADLNIPVDYAKRDRNPAIENNREYAVNELLSLKNRLYKADRELTVVENDAIYKTSYNREMLYMHEHIVHHCALLKIELDSISNIDLDPCFGFAKSTLQHMGIT